MKSVLEIKHKFLFSSLILGLFFIFASCSQVVPDMMNAEGTVIYDYENEDSKPEAHLAVFIETKDDARRADSLKITCLSNNYVWNCEDLVVYKTGDINYCGSVNIYMPENVPFSSGEYEVVYTVLSNETDSGFFYLSSNSALYELKASEVEAYMKEHNGRKKIIVYDIEGKVVYWGLFDEMDDPFIAIPKADKYRVVWTISNNVMCLLPFVNK